MNYVLTESTARWLREQMTRSRGYTAAAQTPSRQIKRDFGGAPAAQPKFHFKYTHTVETEEGETEPTHTVTIGEGAVQIGGYTYFAAEGEVSGMGDGTEYVCCVVTLGTGGVTFVAYASTAALNTAQSDMTKYIFPLYKVVDYKVELDYRPMPNAGCWEIAESVSNGGTSGSGTSGSGTSGSGTSGEGGGGEGGSE